MLLSSSSGHLRLAGLVVLALAGTTTTVRAQGIEVTPFVASYYQITHIASGDVGPISGNPFTIDQGNAFAFGGRVRVPVSSRLGVEGEFVYSTSGVRYTEKNIASSTDGGFSFDGNVVYGSLRAVFTPARSNIFFLVGPGVVHHGGDAWDGFDSGDKTDIAGVAGFGIRANVTPKFRVNLTAESYFYSLDVSGATDGSEFQADLVVSFGIPISLSH